MRLPLGAALAAAILAQDLAAPAVAGPLEDGLAAQARGDYVTAAQLFRPLADQGSASAQVRLGYLYRYGRGVPQDYIEAVKWYYLAANQGDASAQNSIGAMYESGEGVSQDYQEAMKWYHLAAEQGNPAAQYNIGVLYDVGKGILQDYAEAATWYRLAAEQGDGRAHAKLGVLYVNGRGVPRDYVLAYMWYDIASLELPLTETELRRSVSTALGALADRLSPDQFKMALALAYQCRSANFKQCGRTNPLQYGAEEVSQTAPAPPVVPPIASSAPSPLSEPYPPPIEPTRDTTITKGTVVLQVGAFKSEDIANGAWVAFQSRFGNVTGSLVHDIQEVDLREKGVWYRLRIGPFINRSAAADTCEMLKAAGGNCFIAAP